MRIRTPFRLATALLFCGIALLCTTNGWAKGLLPDVSFSSFPQDSYQLAKATFLPDVTDSELGFPDNKLPGDVNLKNCDGYSTGTCPTKAICERCPFDGSKIKIIGCASNWTLTGSACIPNSCTAISSSYKDSIPNNNICTNFVEYTRTCYKNCRAVSCSGYKVSCTNKPEHATSVEKCPDCKNSANSKCGDNVCKVTECESSYKVNADSTGCIMKDDTCPSGYNKTCETGTQGEPKYTELGTACYQCKPKIETCAQYVSSTFPNKTVITSQQELQHALIDNKSEFIIAKDFTISTDIDLSNKTVMGANEIASASTLCAANPKITVQGKTQIKTNNNTEFRKLTFVNKIETKGDCYWSEMISGGGTLRDIEFIFDPVKNTSSSGSAYYTNNWNTPHMSVRGVANFYNVKSTAMKHFTVEDKSTLNIKGKVEAIKPTVYTDISGTVIGASGESPVINIEKTGSLIATTASNVFDSDGGVGDCMLSGKSQISRNGTININGTVTHTIPSTKYSPSTFDWGHGTVNVNKPLTMYGHTSMLYSTLNINAETTLKAINSSIYLSMANGTININAPFKFVGLKAFDKPLDYAYANDGPFDVDNANINSDLIFDARAEFLPVISRGTITFGSKANVRGPARWFQASKGSSTTTRTIVYSSGAKLEIGGVCKKATSSGSFKPSSKTGNIIWKTPQSPFTGGC